MEITEHSCNIDFRNIPVSDSREEMLEQACSDDFDQANRGILRLQREISEKDLVHSDPEFCNIAVDVVLHRGLNHENYTVQCASVGFLGSILSEANGNLDSDAIGAISKSVTAIEELVNNKKSIYYNNDSKKQNKRIRGFALRVYKQYPIIH
jgi:hypothetical protein